MNLKHFQIVLITCVAVFSILALAFLFSGLMSLLFPLSVGAISFTTGGITGKLILGLIFTLLVVFAFWRWGIFRK